MDVFASAIDIAAAIRRKEISPTELVKAYLRRIDELNPQLNAVIWRRDEQLVAEAESATQAVMRGDELAPFHGVPIPIKDLNHVKGWPTTFGSKAARNYIADHDDAVVTGLRRAGFLLMCRTNTPEIGTLPVTENDLFGATRNPWNTEHTPGGSSGGSAAAVAAGLAPIAHGNDGGGSLRIPGGCCGLVGFKSSRGRTPCGPPVVCDVMHGGCVEGAVARSVADSASILDCLCADDPLAWYNAPAPARPFSEEVRLDPGRLRIACMTKAPNGVPVDDACVQAVKATARLLEELGHEIVDGDFDLGEIGSQSTPAFLTVWNTGSAYWPIEDWEQLEPVNAAMRELSRQTDCLTYLNALGKLQNASRRIVSHWGRDFDVLVSPTLATEPPKVGALFEGYDSDPMAPLANAAGVASFTPLFNATGQPAVSLPLHWSPSGLPIGVQLVGGPWKDATLLRLASQLEKARPWRDRRPSVS